MLIKYHSLPEFSHGVQLFQDSLNRLFSEDAAATRPWAPAVDVVETTNELVLKADVPGVSLADIDIQIENGTLTLKGKREFAKDEQDQGYHRIERSYGAFIRCFALPETVDPEKVKADYQNGVLTVAIAKKEVAKPRTVKVNVQTN